MAHTTFRRFGAAIAVLLCVGAAGCSKSSGAATSTPPTGVKPPVWADYCARQASLTNAIQQALNGSLSAGAFAPLLNGIEQSLQQDATMSPDPTKTQLQTLVTAVDTVKVSVTSAVEPDYNQVSGALRAIPTCSK